MSKTAKKAAAPKATKAPKAAPAKKAERTTPAPTKPTATKGKASINSEAKAKANKVSAIDAAAQLLAGAKEPMNAKQLIEAMAAKGLWTSPGGKTPHATLYSAILREINEKGKEARFVKTERGRFAANG